MEQSEASPVPPGYSYIATAILFLLGGLVTAVFSGSLVRLAKHAGFTEVLLTGMIVPTFTWAVQITASGLLLKRDFRRLYWGDLGRICLLGSIALLPGGLLNLMLSDPPLSLSAANVLISVFMMGTDLFRRTNKYGLSQFWPISWCVTITINMTLFFLSSRHWW